MMIDNKRFEKLEEMVFRMDAKIDEMNKAMTGDDFGNNGYADRISRIEKKQKTGDRFRWTILGGVAVISAIIGFLIKNF